MCPKATSLKDATSVIVREHLDILSAKKFDELAQLPSQSSEEVVLEGKKVTLSVWHDVLASQEHRIVVQVYKPGIMGIGRMHADGFAINNENKRRALTREEWAPFS